MYDGHWAYVITYVPESELLADGSPYDMYGQLDFGDCRNGRLNDQLIVCRTALAAPHPSLISHNKSK